MPDPQAPPPSPPSLWDLVPKPSVMDIPGARAVADAASWVQSLIPASIRAKLDDRTPLPTEAEMREQVRQRAPSIPAPIQRGVEAARAYAQSFFEPTPEATALGRIIKERAASQLPLTGDPALNAITAPARALPNLLADQLTDVSSPGGALLNLDVPGGPALAGVPYKPTTIGGIAPRGELAKTLYQVGEHAHDIHPDVIERLGHAYQHGRGMDPKADWLGIATPEMRRAFDQDRGAARFWADVFGATSASTDVPKNTLESIGVLGHALDKPGQMVSLLHEGAIDKRGIPYETTHLYGKKITNAKSKIPSVNKLILGLPNDSPKTGRMGRFVAGDNRVLPIDTHVLYGMGAESDKLDDAHAALRQYFMRTEGLTAKQLAGETGAELMYGRVQDALIRGIQKLDPSREFRPLFGDVWEGIRGGPKSAGLKALPFQGGPADLLRTYDLLDLAAMVDPDKLKRVWRDVKQMTPTPRR